MGDSALLFSFFRRCSRQTPVTAKITPSSSVTQIGGGWHTDRFGRMGFVQFSSDGKVVASDADPLSAPAWISDNANAPVFHLLREGVSRTAGSDSLTPPGSACTLKKGCVTAIRECPYPYGILPSRTHEPAVPHPQERKTALRARTR